MIYKKINNTQGSIKLIILVIIALVISSYFFDFNIQEAIEYKQTQSNFLYIQTHLQNFYNSYLSKPINNLQETIFSRMSE
jgi:hypothetical protein